MSKIKTLTEIQNETGLSKTIIKSLLVDYGIPNVQLGDNKDSLILVDEEQFKKVFTNVNVELSLRVQEKRRKSREYSKKWYSENSDSEIEKATERSDKNTNTFGRRTGHARGQGSMIKRDYELTPEELERRNNKRESRKGRKAKSKRKGHSVLVWYDGTLDDITESEYNRLYNLELKRQKRCAVIGSVGTVVPSVHFLFDFDLEQMLKDNAYITTGNKKKCITKWWDGEIRHWTVNDGIWKK